MSFFYKKCFTVENLDLNTSEYMLSQNNNILEELIGQPKNASSDLIDRFNTE